MAGEQKIKWNTMPGMERIPDAYAFSIHLTPFDMYIGSTGNCGVPIIQNVVCGYKVVSFGSLPAGAPGSAFGEVNLRERNLAEEHVFKMNQDLLKNKAEMKAYVDAFIAKTKANNANCYIMTDSCNRHSTHRSQYVGDGIGTSVFAEYLYANKIGYTVRSPISLNNVHKSPGDFSLVRVYVWYPPWGIAFKEGKYLCRGEIDDTPEKAYAKFAAEVDTKHKSWINKLDTLREAFNSWRK